MAMLEIRNVQKTFRTYAKPGLFHRPGARKVASELPVLRGVDLTVEKGDVVAILGPSGSGKTTLLRCLNFLETADAGQLVFDGESFDLAHASRTDIARLRTHNIYESVAIIAKRANQISLEIKQDLSKKLSEFASYNDSLEEVFENREQIEISRFYEKLPKPTLIATEEFVEKSIYWRDPSVPAHSSDEDEL